MDQQQWLAEHFEDHRPRLRAVAYRMLGSLSEADDAVQDAWLRVSRADTSDVENLSGWLTAVVARVALNMLRARRTRREQPLDTHLPDPIIDSTDGPDPEHEALLADSVGLALLVVLETLNPAERLAFVLHDMFAVPFEEIAPIVGGAPAAGRPPPPRPPPPRAGGAPAAAPPPPPPPPRARAPPPPPPPAAPRPASRARRRVQAGAPAADADVSRQREVVDAFLAAARGGDFDALLEVLDPDVVLRIDRGAVRASREIRGASEVARQALVFQQ